MKEKSMLEQDAEDRILFNTLQEKYCIMIESMNILGSEITENNVFLEHFYKKLEENLSKLDVCQRLIHISALIYAANKSGLLEGTNALAFLKELKELMNC